MGVQNEGAGRREQGSGGGVAVTAMPWGKVDGTFADERDRAVELRVWWGVVSNAVMAT